jgi:predicted  nucleic acid-binding Zn-ribbon protein
VFVGIGYAPLPMEPTSRLLDLQSLDTAIDRMNARRAALEREGELGAARAEAERAEQAFGELRLQLDTFDRDGSKLEHEIDSLTQKAADEESRLFGGAVANAKELESIRREVDNLRKRTAEREDELLVVLERREEVERRAKDAEARAEERRVAVDTVAGDASRELDQIATELTAKQADRERLAAGFDPELLELYDDLRKQKKGVGVAALVDGVCQGCHEKLSAVELDRVKHTEDVPRCEYCRRILVL